jgi:RNA recognition motif-containing protein
MIQDFQMDSETPSEFIDTAIAIKNIPYNYPEKDFVYKLFPQFGLVSPHAFNYHRNNSGRSFRGLAFANFYTANDAKNAVDKLNYYELDGRQLRVELKRKLPPEEEVRQRLTRQSRGQVQSAQPVNTMPMNLEILNPALRPRIIHRRPSTPILQTGNISI